MPVDNDVKALREELGISQKALGEKIGISRQSVNSIENGDTLNYMTGDGDERQRYMYLRGYSLVGKAQLIISALLLMWVMFGNPSIAMLGAGLAGGIVVSVVLFLASVVWRHYKG